MVEIRTAFSWDSCHMHAIIDELFLEKVYFGSKNRLTSGFSVLKILADFNIRNRLSVLPNWLNALWSHTTLFMIQNYQH